MNIIGYVKWNIPTGQDRWRNATPISLGLSWLLTNRHRTLSGDRHRSFHHGVEGFLTSQLKTKTMGTKSSVNYIFEAKYFPSDVTIDQNPYHGLVVIILSTQYKRLWMGLLLLMRSNR